MCLFNYYNKKSWIDSSSPLLSPQPSSPLLEHPHSIEACGHLEERSWWNSLCQCPPPVGGYLFGYVCFSLSMDRYAALNIKRRILPEHQSEKKNYWKSLVKHYVVGLAVNRFFSFLRIKPFHCKPAPAGEGGPVPIFISVFFDSYNLGFRFGIISSEYSLWKISLTSSYFTFSLSPR